MDELNTLDGFDTVWAIECQKTAEYYAHKSRTWQYWENASIYEIAQMEEDAKENQHQAKIWTGRSFNVRGIFD